MGLLPKLRTDITLTPAAVGGRRLIFVRDPLGLADPDLALNAEAGRYLGFFDGTKSARDLQLTIMRERGGALVLRSEIEELVGKFEQLGLLQTESYRNARERVVRDFAERDQRTAAHAGTAYPSDPGELAANLDEALSFPKPGPGPAATAEGPCALAAPHLDLRVAAGVYGSAYRAIRHLRPSGILLLGTGHSLERRYCLTEKTFQTPLGTVAVDRTMVKRLRKAGGSALAENDFAHRSEHSLEFQLLFLQRIFPMSKIPLLPVLCGPLEDLFLQGRRPTEVPEIRAFIGELRDWFLKPPAGKLIVAGVDLSHVGPKFGHADSGTALEAEFRAHDRELLAALEEGEAEAFYDIVARASNTYNVCGFSTLWALLAVSHEVRGRVLDYQVWHEEPTRSAVSCGAVVWERR